MQTAAGSSIDVTARVVAENLARQCGQQAIVINQPGAGGAIAGRALSVAADNDYMLFFAASSVFVVLPELRKALAPEVKASVPVVFIEETPMEIAISPSAPWIA